MNLYNGTFHFARVFFLRTLTGTSSVEWYGHDVSVAHPSGIGGVRILRVYTLFYNRLT